MVDSEYLAFCTRPDTMELHPTLIPKALRGQWGDLSSKVRLFAYDFHILAEPQDREYADYALFLEFDLDEDTKATVTELHLTKGRVAKVQLVPTGQVEFDVKEVKLFKAKELSIFFFSTLYVRCKMPFFFGFGFLVCSSYLLIERNS